MTQCKATIRPVVTLMMTCNECHSSYLSRKWKCSKRGDLKDAQAHIEKDNSNVPIAKLSTKLSKIIKDSTNDKWKWDAKTK